MCWGKVVSLNLIEKTEGQALTSSIALVRGRWDARIRVKGDSSAAEPPEAILRLAMEPPPFCFFFPPTFVHIRPRQAAHGFSDARLNTPRSRDICKPSRLKMNCDELQKNTRAPSYMVKKPAALQWYDPRGVLCKIKDEERQAGRFELFLDLLCTVLSTHSVSVQRLTALV